MTRRRWPRRLASIGVGGIVLVLLVGAIGGLWVRSRVRASLPVLDGDVAVVGLAGPVTIERDAAGVPAISANDAVDLAYALGFVHAQDRFFQMDLLRRRAAGELSALFGAAALDADRGARVHRFRTIARARVAGATAEERAWLEAYAAGVGAGLGTLGAPPPEYLLLRSDPAPWRPEDSLLALFAMYFNLQGGSGRDEARAGLVDETLPPRLAAFLLPASGGWDAPIVGGPLPEPPLPEPADVVWSDARAAAGPPGEAPLDDVALGSNAWAVAGAHTADGGALLANDMHLGLGLPNVWYRVSFAVDGDEPFAATGVTLPGAPLLVAGTNGHVAWGFTNTYGDFSDLVIVESVPGEPDRYRTPDGPRAFDVHRETIAVRGGDPVTLDVVWTVWGPIVDNDHAGRPRALRWVAHDARGANLGLARFVRARNVDEVVAAAPGAGIPAQNVVVADRDGRIAWTVGGAIPRRVGFDGALPTSWADGSRGWHGYVDGDDVPRVVDPPSGRIWTANARVGDAAMRTVIGDDDAPVGARARQIRDRLLELERATPADMLALQLDDRAVFLGRWRELLLTTLDDAAVAANADRATFRDLVRDGWTGRASIDSTAYRLVRAFRLYTADLALEPLAAPCRALDPTFRITAFSRMEGPLWRLVSERPAHLRSPAFATWRDLLLAAVDRAIEEFGAPERALAERTWGERNTVPLRHPLGSAVPALARWLDVPGRPLPGDAHMPRVQSPRFGASERLVVSPGREAAGVFHMPGGQSGHPWSPFYRTGIDDWATGAPSSLLPGPGEHRLTLRPTTGGVRG